MNELNEKWGGIPLGGPGAMFLTGHKSRQNIMKLFDCEG